MADVHFFGQIVGGTGFDRKGLLCKWSFECPDSWERIEGHLSGQTHTAWGRDADRTVWGHPVDIHFECLALDGWPKVCVQVWTVDEQGNTDISGYGFANLPAAPGMYEIECPTWVPEGTAYERFRAAFGGGRPRLKDESVVHSGSDRFRLCTTVSGTVHLRIGCVTRDLAQNGVNVGLAQVHAGRSFAHQSASSCCQLSCCDIGVIDL